MQRLICNCINPCSPVLTFFTAVCVSRVVDQTNANHSKISISIVNFQERQEYFISIYFILPLSNEVSQILWHPTSIRKTYPCNKQRFFQKQNLKVSLEKKMIFLIFLLKTLIVGTRRGGSNEYPQSMFWIKNSKNGYTVANPSFASISEYVLHGHAMLMSGAIPFD